MIRDSALREYADLLERNGFTIYESKDPTFDYFVYSRVVDRRECFGTVQSNGYRTLQFRAYSHYMPIEPSAENGSSMFVEIVKSERVGGGGRTKVWVPDELTVEAAEAVARPRNFNHLVGWQENYRDDCWIKRLYDKRGS